MADELLEAFTHRREREHLFGGIRRERHLAEDELKLVVEEVVETGGGVRLLQREADVRAEGFERGAGFESLQSPAED